MNPAVSLDAALAQDYAVARSSIAAPKRATLLHIGDASTVALTGCGNRSDAHVTMAMGAERTAQAFFRHDPPTALELENAIADVEDHVMTARALPNQDAVLMSTHAVLRELARTDGVGAPGGKLMSLEVVEALFQRLASASLGRPSALRGMPAGPQAAAVLLIVREFMHHLGHGSIVVLDSPPPAPSGR